jgi:hypothetical protein
MSVKLDPERQHDWREIKVTPLLLTDYGGLIPRGPSESSVGCFACNMGFDEGKDVNCPGQDLFEETPGG